MFIAAFVDIVDKKVMEEKFQHLDKGHLILGQHGCFLVEQVVKVAVS